jgi:predicted small lipoprotein YifL
MHHLHRRYLLLLTLLALLAGCGQTGPLYLPEQPEQATE